MASHGARERKSGRRICWSAVILALLLLTISPHFGSGVAAFLLLLFICAFAQARTSEAGDAGNRKA